MKVLVTGVSGFIGRVAAEHLCAAGWSVCGVDRNPPENAPGACLREYHRLHLEQESLAPVLAGFRPDAVVHAAGQAAPGLSMQKPAADYLANAFVLARLLDAMREHSPRSRFVFLSSAAIYGNPAALPVSEAAEPRPISPYGFHKWQGEILCREYGDIYGLPWTALRIFSAYGPGLRRQVVYDACVKAMEEGKLVLRGTGEESRDFVHVRDIARAIELVATHPDAAGRILNLASGAETSIRFLAERILCDLGLPASVAFAGVSESGSPVRWRADLSALRALGFAPQISLEEGIRQTVAWCREIHV